MVRSISNKMSSCIVELVNSFGGSSGTGEVARRSVEFLRKSGNEDQAHGRLCRAMIEQAEGGNADMSSLLHFYGDSEVFLVVYNNITHAKLPTAKWLANEILKILQSRGFGSLFLSSSKLDSASTRLPLLQQHLVGVVCRLPDVMANRLGRQLKEALLPKSYFRYLGEGLLACLEGIHRDIKGGFSVLFAAGVLGTAAALGQQGVVMEAILPSLEGHVTFDPTWRELSQQLFTQLPPAGLEPVLEALVNLASPSLLPSSVLNLLIGRAILDNHKAKFVLAHKLILIRVPSSPHAAHNLLGYLVSDGTGRGLVGKSLQSVLEVWSDSTSLRHMDRRQHAWISRVLVLGVNLLRGHEEFKDFEQGFLKLLMSGVETHVQCPLPEVRHLGMVVGECLMNKLHPTKDEEHRLKFDYPIGAETEAIRKLARPVAEQEAELLKEKEELLKRKEELLKGKAGVLKGKKNLPEETKGTRVVQGDGGAETVKEECKAQDSSEDESPPPEMRFGEGYVRPVDCTETDSDDDLVPYALDDDPDSTQPNPPRYLRTLMQDLLATKEPQKIEVALKTAEPLVRSQPSDLTEVCVELAKLLLHLSDSFAMEDFAVQRHKALVALAALCPQLVTPYLTQQFYSPNYSLRHRLDILEVISSAALELSHPSLPTSPPLIAPHPPHLPSGPAHWTARKPWEEIIRQRLEANTRIISKGPSRPPATPTPNRFLPVAPLFFFPLMNRFDQPMNTLDLLGEDSLVLGNLLYTLGTVMHAAAHLPTTVAMAMAFLDFMWTLRYHPNAYVRQGVLYGLGMLVWATPTHTLLGELSKGLMECVAWMKEVLTEDADEQCRVLAGHSLTLLNSTMHQSTAT